MGQYYKIIFLDNQENILAVIEISWGLKLLEHAYLDTPWMTRIEFLLSPLSKLYKSKIVWAGDYADSEKNQDKNLYTLTRNFYADNVNAYNELQTHITNNLDQYLIEKQKYKYIVNHTKKEFVIIDKISHGELHPLPFLVAEGNGRGGGDYYGENENLVGCWARDIVSWEKEEPNSQYTEFYKDTLFKK